MGQRRSKVVTVGARVCLVSDAKCSFGSKGMAGLHMPAGFSMVK